jgi:(+)-pinoresinol hydroxylase
MQRAISLLMVLCAGLATNAMAGAAPKPDHAAGEAVFTRWCVHCHSTGRGNPGTESLQVKYGGKIPAALLERTDLTAEGFALFVRQGVLSMPPFRKTEITDVELKVLTGYLARNYRKRR